MKKIFYALVVLTLIYGCEKDEIRDFQDDSIQQVSNTYNRSATARTIGFGDDILTGYNLRWMDTPDFATTNVMALADSLQTEIFRYPGGTITHDWDWAKGERASGKKTNDVVHKIGDVKKLLDATQASTSDKNEVSFVVDIVNGTVADQIKMINATGIAKDKIVYIEMGNEIYAKDYKDDFATGKEYAEEINDWVPTLRKEYTNAKIGISLIGRSVGTSNTRGKEWNKKVTDNIDSDVTIDAHIYHIYMNSTGTTGSTVDSRFDDFKDNAFITDSSVETWITEYGDKGQDIDKTLALGKKLTASPISAKVLINHGLIVGKGTNFTKIKKTSDAKVYTFTDDGLAYLYRFNPYLSKLNYEETFEDYSSTTTLKKVGFRSFKTSSHTLAATDIIKFEESSGNYTDKDAVTSTSDKGIIISVDKTSTYTGSAVLENFIITPSLITKDSDKVKFNVDVAYDFKDQNNATIEYYWSSTYTGGMTFDSTKWTSLGTNSGIRFNNDC